MQPADRLHALDAVRAYALLLGVVLHGSAAFLAGFPIPMWIDTPSDGAPVIYYVIHMFRMSAFFLIAGFFARVLVERRGPKGFAKDRAKRVALPLVLFIIVANVAAGVGLALGALPHGVDYLMSLVQAAPPAPGAGGPAGAGAAPAGGGGGPGGILSHLWFLYYLLIFYALTPAIRPLVHGVDRRGRVAAACDRVVKFVMTGVWGPVLIALPIAAYLYRLDNWTEWLGLPAPFFLTPDPKALIGYGTAFWLGWLLHRQPQALLDLQKLWYVYLVLAVALTIFCLATIGTAPRWASGALAGTDRLLYTAAYVVGLWCWVFAFVGAAVRFLSTPHSVTRYLADASYWVYLMHLSTLIFFITLLRPFDWHWTLKLTISISGSMAILLPTYHWFVRFTWIGAMLNGRRHPRPEKSPPPSAATAPS